MQHVPFLLAPTTISLPRTYHARAGQTTVEYLLLMAVAASVAYLVLTGPFATFTQLVITSISGALGNAVQYAEVTTQTVSTTATQYPGNPARFRPLH